MHLGKTVALITGGAQGFGREFARSILINGGKVVIADINNETGEKFQKECFEKFGNSKMKFLQLDVTNSQKLSDVFDEAKSCFGLLNVVCNNAGMMTTDIAHSSKQITVNLTAVIEGTFKAISLMSKQNGGQGGVVVNISSAAGFQLMKHAPVYTASKFGVTAFTRSFKHMNTHEVDGVRVNALCPLFCDTEMLRQGCIENPRMKEEFSRFGLVDIADVVKAFVRCVENDTMNAQCTAILPEGKIFDLSFPPAVPKL